MSLLERVAIESKIFVTDYASYNEGSQFEFGHWVDLNDFTDEDDLMDYIKEHFQKADKIRPLDSPREEIMITDYEGFPSALYSESMDRDDFKKVYNLIEYMDDNNLETFENEDDNLLDVWNEYCREVNNGDEIYNFDDGFMEFELPSNPREAFTLGLYSKVNLSDDYIFYDGRGNLESTDDPSKHIEVSDLINYIIRNL